MDRILVQRLAFEVRSHFGIDNNSPIDLFALINSNPEITLVYYPFNDEISGMCIKSAKLIAVNSKSTLGRQAFSIAHELYHYYYDDNKSTISYFDSSDKAIVEQNANLFASYLLMPDSSFSRFCNKLLEKEPNKIDLRCILEIEQYFRVSRQAVLVRLILDNYITIDESEQYKTDIIKNANKYGFDTSLYMPSSCEKPRTFGSYLKKALELKKLGLISDGKYEEYLLEAHRSDIVFGDNGEIDIYD